MTQVITPPTVCVLHFFDVSHLSFRFCLAVGFWILTFLKGPATNPYPQALSPFSLALSPLAQLSVSAAEEQNVSELFFAFCGEPSGEESLFLDYLCDGHQHFEVEVSLVQGADHQEGCFDVGLFRVEDDPVLAPNDDQIESAFSGNDRMGDRQARLKDGAALGFAMLEGLCRFVSEG